MNDEFVLENGNYEDPNDWTENDFKNYQKWCIYHCNKGSMICRECWHLHCHPNKCTMQTRVVEQCKALIETGVFPKEICKMIAIEIPEQDQIN